jgi:hypothetical protein
VKLVTSPTVFVDSLAAGYDPDDFPSWVARPLVPVAELAENQPLINQPPKAVETPSAGSVQPVQPVGSTVQTVQLAGSPVQTVETAGSVDTVQPVKTVPIEGVEKPLRLLPTQPPQPTNRTNQPASQNQLRSTGATIILPEIIYAEGKQANRLKISRVQPEQLLFCRK